MNYGIFKDGELFTGCNYWASHAGINMWSDWQPDVIDRDFAMLEKHNIKNLRIFPLWPDFQPLKMHRICFGEEYEIRMGEEPLPFTPAGRAGVSEVMADRFGQFCDLAEKHGMKLIVGLVTGWMSGRMFTPPLFESVDVLTDPRAIKWEIKYVKYMVNRFKSHPAITAWDLGNECNCMGHAGSHEAAYVWINAITSAIKSEDSERPVISGMHTTFPELDFRPEDLGEILDILCTHPYVLFTPHCDTDPITENKSVMHAIAETVMYRGFSGKPAFAEECGTLGPMISSEENSAAYANTVLHMLWAHNCLGFMWWCGFEQTKLTRTPYDWNAVERELGLFREDFTPKPIVETIGDFTKFAEGFEYKKLPPRIVDAVCIITQKKDTWLPTYGAFLLAKGAGLDIEFRYLTQEIPEARAYIIPSINDSQGVNRHTMELIMSRVEKGAVLYISIANALLSPVTRYYGIKTLCHYKPIKPDRVSLEGIDYTFTLTPPFKVPFEACGDTKILARDEDGIAVMSEAKYGKGTVYFLSEPIEFVAGNNPGVISGPTEAPLYRFYEAMPLLRNPEKKVSGNNPHVTYTEHIIDENTRVIVAVNCIPRESKTTFSFDGYTFSRTLKNQNADVAPDKNSLFLTMKPNSAVVFEIKK